MLTTQVLPKSKSNAGLGRTLINDRTKAVQKARQNARGGKTPQVRLFNDYGELTAAYD